MRLVSFVMLFMLAGCATVTGDRILESRYDQIQKGASSTQNVIALLGTPSQVMHPDGQHTVFFYQESKIYHEYWFLGKKKIDTLRLSIYFDENDIAVDCIMDRVTNDYLVPRPSRRPKYSNSDEAGEYYN